MTEQFLTQWSDTHAHVHTHKKTSSPNTLNDSVGNYMLFWTGERCIKDANPLPTLCPGTRRIKKSNDRLLSLGGITLEFCPKFLTFHWPLNPFSELAIARIPTSSEKNVLYVFCWHSCVITPTAVRELVVKQVAGFVLSVSRGTGEEMWELLTLSSGGAYIILCLLTALWGSVQRIASGCLYHCRIISVCAPVKRKSVGVRAPTSKPFAPTCTLESHLPYTIKEELYTVPMERGTINNGKLLNQIYTVQDENTSEKWALY